jgi:esterase/lipase
VNVHIDAGGYKLLGRLYRPNKNSRRLPAALFIRGWTPGLPRTFMELHARICARKLGMVCLAAEFRGMGSPGDANALTRSDFFQDALAAYDALYKTEGVDTNNIYVVGESLGAYLACLLTAERAVKGLVLRVPADFPDEGFADEADLSRVIERTYGWRAQAHAPGESMALGAINRFPGGVLIVASGRDALIPKQTTDNYLAATEGRAKLICMEKAGHSLFSPLKHKRFQRMLVEWLCKRITCIDGNG